MLVSSSTIRFPAVQGLQPCSTSSRQRDAIVFSRNASSMTGLSTPSRALNIACCSYRTKPSSLNADFSKTAEFQRHETDTGSPEYQIARITARVEQLTKHLIANRKDFASRRGLQMLLEDRRRHLKYLRKMDPEAFQDVVQRLSLRTSNL